MQRGTAAFQAVLGDLWHFGADPDPDLWLVDRDPTPDPTHFFSDFSMQKFLFFIFFSKSLPAVPAGTLSSVFCVKILLCEHYFSWLNTFMRKGKDPELDPDHDLYLWLMDPDPDPESPKTCRSGSPTMVSGWWTREKARGAIVHKAGSKIPTWLTVSPVYKLY